MGFKKVYKVLVEVFPEVDSRALRAVAIEHQKDADSAVEVVLAEVIPFLAKKSTTGSSYSENAVIVQSPEATEVFANGTSSAHDGLAEYVKFPDEEQHGPFYDAKTEHDQTFHDANDGLHQTNLDGGPVKLASVTKCDESIAIRADMSTCVSSTILTHDNGANTDRDKVSGDLASEETPSEVSQESSTRVAYDQISQLTLKPLDHGSLGFNQSLDDCLPADPVHIENYEKNISVENSVDHLSPSSFEPLKVTSLESIVQLLVMPDIQNSDLEKELNGLKDAAPKTESSNETFNVEDESVLNNVVTQSGQICSIDLFEDIITDARNNKKILLSAMETVISLMKEVELQEKAAEEAKQDAANGGLEILSRVKDLKQMLQHAKEANDMHAGEVYGEKAILATEVRELQSRLLCLSDERDKSLGILDEMRQSLEVQLAAAEKERRVAEEEKLGKEEIARKALKDQEVIMEKVVQEANILKQEAEENAKLRDFLIDRGLVVDTLQGEISVICTDVKLLKEKFDERLPLSKSLTSSQTSCILASSSSTSKGTILEQVDQVIDQADLSETPEKIDLWPCFYDPWCIGEDTARDDHKKLADEGWEILTTTKLACKYE